MWCLLWIPYHQSLQLWLGDNRGVYQLSWHFFFKNKHCSILSYYINLWQDRIFTILFHAYFLRKYS
jgi:hypothetical protein